MLHGIRAGTYVGRQDGLAGTCTPVEDGFVGGAAEVGRVVVGGARPAAPPDVTQVDLIGRTSDVLGAVDTAAVPRGVTALARCTHTHTHAHTTRAMLTTTGLQNRFKKVRNGTLDIAPLRESSPQKRSGVTRVLEGSHSFTCKPTRSSAIEMSHICLCLPSYSWYSFTDRGGMEG